MSVISYCLISSMIVFVKIYDVEICLYKPWRPKGFLQFKIIMSYSYLFLLHLNIYVMDLRSLNMFNFLSAGIDIRRQNLTSDSDV